jgi:hypothetical protein
VDRVFKKGDFIGHLGFITVDCTITRSGKIYWTNKQVLTLLDEEGRPFTNAQFRKNAYKQAENFFKSLGWVLGDL